MKAFRFCPLCAAPLIDKVVTSEPRRVCSANCGFIHYDNPTPVVAAIVEHQGKIVMARNRAWPKHIDFYGLITGFLERNESPEECALREVKEELDLDADRATLVGAYAFPQMNQVIIGYHVIATGVIKLNEELDAYRHVPFEQCQAWSAGTGYALRDWLRTKGIEAPMMDLAALWRARVEAGRET
jgi:NADH pyrophosphatase NudC (nudix superfamily)